MAKGSLEDVRSRLRDGKLTKDDHGYLNGLLARAEAEGLGEKVAAGRRVLARLPHGMDIVK